MEEEKKRENIARIRKLIETVESLRIVYKLLL